MEEEVNDKGVLIQCPVPFHQWNYKTGGREYRGVRTKRFTYVRDLDGPWLLYDKSIDPYQMNNLVGKTAQADLQKELEGNMKNAVQGVAVTKILEDESPARKVYDPSHPDAKEDGYVEMPNISVLKEMVDMMSATRAYQANVTTIKSAKRMALKALEIGR